ncbi:MAG: RNA polymerase sigma factor, partial [Actinomycetota bacterium]
MSTSTSRKLPADILAHPEVVALLERGKAAGQVSSDAVRDTSEAASISGKHLKALLRFLTEEGVTVVLSADESTSRKVAAAASSRSTVKASTAKKAPAKKAP